MKKILKTIIVLSIVFSIIGCSTSSQNLNSQNNKSTKKHDKVVEKKDKIIIVEPEPRHQIVLPKETINFPPNELKMKIEVENYKIVKVQLLDDIEYEVERVKVTGEFIHINKVLLRLEAENFPKYHWLAYLPSEKDGNGTFTVFAKLNDDNIVKKSQDLNKPPTELIVQVVFKDGKVIDMGFEKIRPWWGKFIYTQRDREKELYYFKNNKFKGKIWAAKYPKDVEGTYDLTLELEN